MQMPEPDATVRIIGQQWAWSFVHPGPDGQLGDSVSEVAPVAVFGGEPVIEGVY